MAYLTDRALASGVTLSDLLHIVIPSDVSQNPDGSSYKATIQQVGDALSGSSFNTYVFSGNADVATSTLTFLNNSGGTFTVTNSAALFSDNDINVTGGTYNPSNGCVTFITNSGTTFDVCGFLTGFTDTFVTGGTYSAGTATFTNSSGGTFDVTGFTSTDTNFANTDLTFTADRTHELNGRSLTIQEGSNQSINMFQGFAQQFVFGNSYFEQTGTYQAFVVNNVSQLDLITAGAVFNNSGADLDFRVESDTNPNMLFVDGGLNRVGIGTNTPAEELDVNGKTKTINFQMTSGGTTGYVLSSIDNDGNAQWGNLSSLYTGNTSGDCITDLFVSNIHSCSPLNINPLDEGNVYFGSTSGVTIDLTNNYVGIGESNPDRRLVVSGSKATLYVDTDEEDPLAATTPGNRIFFEGNPSGSTRIAFGAETNVGVTIGQLGSLADSGNLGFGNPLDSFIYSNSQANNLNIITKSGGGTDDNIRFYTGLGAEDISGTTSAVHIHGDGSNRGYVGINNENPTYRLDISGTTGRLFYDGDTDRNQYRQSQIYNEGPSTGITAISIFSDGAENGLEMFSIGTGVTNSVLWRFAGEPGDVALYATSAANNLNIMNNFGPSSSGNSNNIRFYAGSSGTLSGNTSAMHIQGSGSTKGYIGINNENPQFTLDVVGETRLSGSGQNVLTVIGSGDTQPLFTVQGSSGELFSVTDSLVGSLFSVNDISGLPVLEVFDDDTIHMGNYQAPSLNTTVKLNPGTGLSDVYSIPVSAYTGAFFDYTVLNSTGARAGNIMSIFSGSTVEFLETPTNSIGTTSDVTFTMSNDGSNATLQVSATTTGWEVKTIVRSI